MKKETINNALYHAVVLTDFEGDTYRGWLVPKDKGYVMLTNNIWKIPTFKASHIKSIMFLTNGVTLK